MLKVESVKYKSYDLVQEAGYLFANLQDRVEIITTYSIERAVYLSSDNQVYLVPPPHIYDSIDNLGIIYALNEDELFTEFQVGDIIRISTAFYTGTNTITQKIDNNTIRIDNLATGSHILEAEGEFIACTHAPKSLIFKNNIINVEDSPTYINHLDGQENAYELNGIDTNILGGVWNMTPIGSVSHQMGLISVRYSSNIGSYKFVFEITQRLRMYPFLKGNYASLLEEGSVLTDWAGILCYRYIFSVALLASRSNTDSQIVLESLDQATNTGGYNEHFNTNASKYRVESVRYSVGGVEVGGIDLNKLTDITIVYKSEGLFTGSFITEVSFVYIQEDFDNYIDTNQTYQNNFVFDAVNSLSGHEAIGENRVFTGEFGQTIIDSSTLEVKVRTFIRSLARENIDKSETKKYALFITSERMGTDVADKTRSRDLVHLGELSEVLPTANLISTQTNFSLDPDNFYPFSFVLPDTFMTDDVYAISRVTWSKDNQIKFISIKNEIVALGVSTSSNLVLDGTVTNLAGLDIGPDGAQPIEVDIVRPLNQSYKTNLLLTREEDGEDYFVLGIGFPFIVGYREDLAINNQGIPSEVYSPSEIGQGATSDWYKYIAAGMEVKYRITYVYEYLGIRYSQQVLKPIAIHDYKNTPEWAQSLHLYDNNNNEVLLDTDTYALQGTMSVVGKFSKTPLPNINKIHAYFFVARDEENGYRTSSTFNNAYKKIIYGSKAIVGSEIHISGTINADDFKGNVSIWCRLFEEEDPELPECILISEDDIYLGDEGGIGFLIPEMCGEPVFDLIIDPEGNFLADPEGNNLIAL